MKPVAPVTRTFVVKWPFLRASRNPSSLCASSLHSIFGPAWHVPCIWVGTTSTQAIRENPMQLSGDQREARSVVDRQRRGADRDISAVVVNYNGARTVLDTIESIYAQQGVRVRVVVVDDGSSDGRPEAIAERLRAVEMHREPRNTKDVNRLRNIGLSKAQTD